MKTGWETKHSALVGLCLRLFACLQIKSDLQAG